MDLHQLLEEGIAYTHKGNHSAAIKAFEAILRHQNTCVSALYYIGYNHFLMQRFELALHYYEQALAIEPNNAHIISQKGVLLFHQGKKEESLEAMNQAQRLEPDNPYRYASRAFIKDALGDIHGAIQDYQRALELDPDDAIALNNLGLLEEKLGYHQAAQKKFIRADELAKKIGYTFKNTPPQPADSPEKWSHQKDDTSQPMNSAQPNQQKQTTVVKQPSKFATLLRIMWQTILNAQLQAEFFQFVAEKLSFKKKS
ncbi:MAG: tetratricopeptide repeat protein [Cytophagales bacterium]|nr:tetratricopeptide repeat protein [Bernardetiaceae bacterium]MDW8210959.1 tetratricopeptide repeat protein [Cytophagales bacterium]